jgi:hypothetical protein
MKKFFVCFVALVISISFVGCKKKDSSHNYDSTTSHYNIILDNKDTACPSFLTNETGFSSICDFNLLKSKLQLYARRMFVFIAFDKYVMRYNVELNEIDRIVNLGSLDSFQLHDITCSSNGRYMISCVLNLDSNDPKYTAKNYYLIDFDLQTSTLLADSFSEMNSKIAEDKIPEDVRKEYYNLSFSIEELKSNKISESKYVHSIYNKFDNRNICTSLIDLNTLVVVCPIDTKHNKLLKDYILLVIDLNTDSLINELHFSFCQR